MLSRLALGARGDAALVRQGAEQGQVTAAFDIARRASGAPACSPTTISSPTRDDDELIVRRVQFADGRTRAFVNDQPVSVQVLRALGAALVEIHGQHDDRAFVEAATHRALLDAYGGTRGRCRRSRGGCGTSGARCEAAVAAPPRRRRARPARSRMAAPCGRGTRQRLAPRDRRGDRARRPPHRHDAGGKSRPRICADPRQRSAARNSPVPPLATAVRRLERRAAQAPALIEPAVKAIDAALTALDEARVASRTRAARRRIRSARTRAHRGAAVRAARRRRANTMCRSTISPRWRAATRAISP